MWHVPWQARRVKSSARHKNEQNQQVDLLPFFTLRFWTQPSSVCATEQVTTFLQQNLRMWQSYQIFPSSNSGNDAAKWVQSIGRKLNRIRPIQPSSILQTVSVSVKPLRPSIFAMNAPVAGCLSVWISLPWATACSNGCGTTRQSSFQMATASVHCKLWSIGGFNPSNLHHSSRYFDYSSWPKLESKDIRVWASLAPVHLPQPQPPSPLWPSQVILEKLLGSAMRSPTRGRLGKCATGQLGLAKATVTAREMLSAPKVYSKVTLKQSCPSWRTLTLPRFWWFQHIPAMYLVAVADVAA